MKFSNFSSIFDVGIELEFFLTDGNGIVYNASKEMQDILGFNIDQNVGDGALRVNNHCLFRTDGTVCELQFDPRDFSHFTEKQFTNRIGTIIPKIKLIEKYNKSFCPFIEEGDVIDGKHTIFDSPNDVFASEKMICNAYSGEHRISEKKEGSKVSIRTAGLHLHFSLNNGPEFDVIRDKFNETIFKGFFSEYTHRLIKQLDSIYADQIVPLQSRASKLRVQEYQKLGDYRIKRNTLTKNPTFEYRQLDASLYNTPHKLFQFINTFQICAYEDLSERLEHF